ncbi:SDR family oxidoreductase [Candidatus Binatia bacterium]|nr:SDR family oxidoreductase [Candidatus Binatia bacterium]
MRLQGQVAVVTGAARGIGLGIARCLAAEGASIGIVDIDGTEAQTAAANLGVPAIGIAADISQEREAIAAVDAVAERFGGLDIMVNNAGGGGPNSVLSVGNPFTRVEQAGWDDQLTTNLRTTFAGCKAAIPHLERRGGGSIVNIASIAGLVPNPAIPAYGAAKAGVIHVTRSLGLELGPKNIRVNAICPGFLWTRAWEMLAMLLKMTVPRYADMEPRDIFMDQVRSATPLGREQTPEDIGKLVVFLASADAQNITGQAISVDGGITLRVGPSRDVG